MGSVVAAVATLTVLGLPIALLLDRRSRGGELAGLGFLYGTALVYAVMLALDVFGVGWSLVVVMAIAIAISAVSLWGAGALAGASSQPRRRGRRRSTETILDVATVLFLATFTAFALSAPLWQWDFWAIWGLKARVFLEHGGIDWRFLESRWNDFVHPDYPMLLPFNLTFTAMLQGGWDDRWLGLIFVAFGAATVLVVRSFAAREVSGTAAAAIGLAATSFGMSRYVGLAEGPLIAFATSGLLVLRQALRDDDRVSMRNGAILLGFAASCKNEGLALVVSAALAVVVVDRRRWRRIAQLWPALLIVAPWKILTTVHALQVDLAAEGVLQRLLHRLGAADAIFAALVTGLADRWIWLAMLVGLLAVSAAHRRRERFLLATVGIQLAIYVTIYFSTLHDVMWHIATSWPRLTRQLGTLLLFAVLVMLATEFRTGSDDEHAEARPEQ